MTIDPTDPRWPRLLGLAVHEFRTPITVVAGYIRMLLKERAGAITDQQRKLLEEAEKSCGRLSGLVAEMSDLSALESGTAALNVGKLELEALLKDVIAGLPDLPDRSITVEFEACTPATVTADANRLRLALSSLLLALRRELVTTDRLMVRLAARDGDQRAAVIAIADPERIERLMAADPESLSPFNEWRGGSGLSLAIARRIIGQHGGLVRGPESQEDKASAVVLLPVVT